MAQSSPINVGDEAVIAQYNNLRDDVLSSTLGHRHGGGGDGREIPHSNIGSVSADQHHTGFIGLRDGSDTTITPSATDYIKIYSGNNILTSIAETNQLKLTIIEANIDHGNLNSDSLDDDDHGAVYPNYGDTETITGSWTFNADVTIGDAYKILWSDVNLYRGAVNILKTDDSLTISIGLNMGTATGSGTGEIRLANSKSIGIGSSDERIEFYTAGYIAVMGAILGIGVASPSAGIHVIRTDEQLRLGYDAAKYLCIEIEGTDDVNISATGNLLKFQESVTIQSESYASQTTGWHITYGGAADLRYLYVDEMHAKAFIADLEQALAGGQIISKSVAPLSRDFTAPAAGNTAYLWVECFLGFPAAEVFVTGDTVMVRNFSRSGGGLDITNCFGTVSAPYFPSPQSDPPEQRWTFTRLSGTVNGHPAAGYMSTSTVVKRGALALDFGTTGMGYHEVNAIDGLMGVNSPYAQVVTWDEHPWYDRIVRTRTGNLNGIFGTPNEYGLFAGEGHDEASGDQYMRLSSEGFDIFNLQVKVYDGANLRIHLEPTTPYLAVGSATAIQSGNGVWMGRHGDPATYKFRVGVANGTQLLYDGTSVYLRGSTNNYLKATSSSLGLWADSQERIGLTSAGILTVKDSGGNAVITLDAALGAEITKKLTMPGENSAISIGSTPPIADPNGLPATGTGIWIDRTGMYGLLVDVLQAKFDAVTGAIEAGAGVVFLNSGGIGIEVSDTYSDTRAYKFRDSTGDVFGRLRGLITETDSYVSLYVLHPDHDTNSNIYIEADSYPTHESTIRLEAHSLGGGMSFIECFREPNDATGYIQLDSYTISNIIEDFAASRFQVLKADDSEILGLGRAGQLALPLQGSTAGLLLGGDALWYRSAANLMRTPDNVKIDGGLDVGDDIIIADGKDLHWSDVNLYRSAANMLKTDDGLTVALNLVLAGAISYSAATFSMKADTADGSDTKQTALTGGGTSDATRGASIIVSGNEHGAHPGKVRLVAGNIAGGIIELYTENTLRETILKDGGHLMPAMKTGTSQANAGAAVGELWAKSDDFYEVRLGVA